MWKRTVRAFKFSQASSALRTGLFAFVPPLRLAIAEIRKECVYVETRRLFAVGQGETITLEAFLERQRTNQQEVAQVCRLAFSACRRTKRGAAFQLVIILLQNRRFLSSVQRSS